MKNLNVIRNRILDLGQTIVGMCFDADNGHLFFMTGDTTLLKVQPDDEISILKHDYDFKSIGIDKLKLEDIKFIDFIVENGSLLVVLAEGYIIRIGVSSYSLSSETLYKHDCKIESFKLSPDQDLIALADINHNIHILTADCDILHSSNALTQNESLHKPVGVGWGSKETQFFGLDGRPSKEDQLKKNSQQVNGFEVETIEGADAIYRKQKISTTVDWRGDGQYIASLTFLEESHKHCLKVWNRNLELQYMSEKLVTVEQGILSWIPNGQYICCAQHREINKNDIAMFEKNGMVHQRISLPNSSLESHVSDLAWSPDSKLLAIISKEALRSENQLVTFQNSLLLYTMQNFHYYLKFSCKLEAECDLSLKWNPIIQNRIHIMSFSGSYSEFDCISQVCSGEDLSTVAVLDANRILLTPFKLCNIPPPMSALVVELNSTISRLVVNPRLSSDLYILTSNKQLIHTSSNYANSEVDMLKFKIENRVAQPLHDLMKCYKVYKMDELDSYQNFIVIEKGFLIATKYNSKNSELYKIKLNEDQNLKAELFKKFEASYVNYVPRDCRDDPGNLVVILSDKSTVKIDLETKEVSVLFRFSLTETVSCYSFIAAEVIRLAYLDNVISLDRELTLRFNECVIASNCCTSFQLVEHYLIYTTTDNGMHFILLEHLLAERVRNIAEPPSQVIELGGTLILASEPQSKVILQMPRGNLEILHPRVLVFSALTKLLDDKEFVLAVEMARRHRLNMNFIADYFLHSSRQSEDLNHFANVIAKHDPALLNLFLTELDDSDTLTGRYRAVIIHLPPRKINFLNSRKLYESEKVNLICSTISLPEEPKYIQPTLLSLLKQTPRKCQDALTTVHKLGKGPKQNEALKFILYFIDIDQLFREALCTYDTDITLMVASASNKDPKEYLALLDNFNKIDNKYLRRYTIDLHVKRYQMAFESLAKYLMDNPDEITKRKELIDLVETKRIHQYALLYYETTCKSNDSLLLETLWSKYASYLWEKRYYPEAGFAYSKAYECNRKEEFYKFAKRCYLMVDDWQKILAMSARLKDDDKIQIEEEITKLSDQLVESGKCVDFMIIQSQFLRKKEYRPKEFKACLESGMWYIADFMATYLQDRPELKIELLNALADSMANKVSQMSDELTKIKIQFARLKTILEQLRESEALELSNTTTAEGGNVSDTLSTLDGSEVSSVASSGSVNSRAGGVAKSEGVISLKTRASTKTNKSQAVRKKRINLKEGSRHEDLALVLEIKKFISSQKAHQDESRDLVAAYHELSRNMFDTMDSIYSLNSLLSVSLNYSQEMLETLWPQSSSSQVDVLKYSLYERYQRKVRDADENVDFEVLIRPELSQNIHLFEISR